MAEDAQLQQEPPAEPQLSPMQAYQQGLIDQKAPAPAVAPELYRMPSGVDLVVGEDITRKIADEIDSIRKQASAEKSDLYQTRNREEALAARVKQIDAAKVFGQPQGLQTPAAPAAPVAQQPALESTGPDLAALTAAFGDEQTAKAVSDMMAQQDAKFQAQLAKFQPIIEQNQQQQTVNQFKAGVFAELDKDPDGVDLDKQAVYDLACVGVKQGYSEQQAYDLARDQKIREKLTDLQSTAEGNTEKTLPAGPTGASSGLPAALNSGQQAVGPPNATLTTEQYLAAHASGIMPS